MSLPAVIPCSANEELRTRIELYAEELRVQAHQLGSHGLSEQEFYNSGLFRGAIERIRGQFSATTRDKRDLAARVLNYLEDNGLILGWDEADSRVRYDYDVKLKSNRLCAVAVKGCLDGNNATILGKPENADEMVLWSMCTNQGADPRRNVWSGIHTRISAEYVEHGLELDAVVVWDMMCGTIGRSCPKLIAEPARAIALGSCSLPPPCVYVLPRQDQRQTGLLAAQKADSVEFVKALTDAFGGRESEINFVDFEVERDVVGASRRTIVKRNGVICYQSEMTPIDRA